MKTSRGAIVLRFRFICWLVLRGAGMKQITIEIPCCFCCPRYEYNGHDFVHWCNELDRVLDCDTNTIDPECPLPDRAN